MTNKTLSDELIEEAYTRITAHKLDVIGKKLQRDFEACQPVDSPDIPEFMKPKHLQIKEIIKEKVKLHLLMVLRSGRLDYFYNLAIESEV